MNIIENYITERYNKQVEWYDSKAIVNKRLTYLFHIPIILFAAITPIFAALELKIFTIIGSSIVASGLGILKICQFESLWHNYRSTCETLKKEKIYFDTLTDVYYNIDNPEKLFVERIESIISREHTKWEKNLAKKENNINRGQGGV